jgi:polysaccharide export outer membrane protein
MSCRTSLITLIAASAMVGGCATDRSVDGLGNSPVAVAGWSAERPVLADGSVMDDTGPYQLDTGDKLRVFVYGQPSISRLYTVDQEGKVSMPLIGGVRARGLTTYGLEKVLRDKLGASYVRDPQVTVDIQQNRPFFIHGEVRSAGQFPFVNGMTGETAVAIAGGYSERADHRRIKVTRRSADGSLVMEVSPSDPLRPGDVVYVYERFF